MLFKYLPIICGTRRYIAVITSPPSNTVLNLTVSIHMAKIYFILFFHLLLALPDGLFFSDFPFIFCVNISPAYVILLDFIAVIAFDE